MTRPGPVLRRPVTGPGPTGGRPAAVFRFRSRRLEITDQSAVLRPPELRAS